MSSFDPTDDTFLRERLADRYAVGPQVGKGGMGIVYRAVRRDDGQEVALKVLRPELAISLGLERFHREIALVSHLKHPRIVTLQRSGTIEHHGGLEIPYYDMPYVGGESLRARLDREGALPLADAIRITLEVGEGLAEAHRAGIIHRDIKPENILLTPQGAVLVDFGAARAVAQAAADRITESGLVVGTPSYMSPEQAGAEATLDGRSDIYSLACVLFEMLAGEPPFTGPSSQAIVARHLHEAPRSLRVVRPGVPEGMDRHLARALQKLPGDRFQTVEEFLAVLDTVTGAAPRPRRMAIAVLVGVGGLALAAVLYLVWPHPPELDDEQVMVFPLTPVGEGDSPSDGWDAALAIGQALEHTRPLRFLDGWRELDSLRRADPRALTPDQASRVARRSGARYFVDGTIRSSGDSIHTSLGLYDASTGARLQPASASGPAGTLPRVALQAMSVLLPRLIDSARSVDLTPLTDRQPAAVALWLLGERAYRESRFVGALDFYERAVAEDSLLGIAAVKGAQAASWESRFDRVERLLDVALAPGVVLPARWRRLAIGMRAYASGLADSAVAQLTRLAQDESRWPEASAALGEVFYHLLPSVSAPDSAARQWFLAAAGADSGFAPPRVHLAEMALRDGAVGDADRWIRELRRLEPRSPELRRLGLMRDCVAGDLDRQGWLRAARESPGDVFGAGRELLGGARQPSCADGAAEAILRAVPDSAALTYGAFLIRHGVLMATGQFAAVERLLDSTIAAGLGAVSQFYVLDLLAGAPLQAKASEVERGLRERLGDGYAGASPNALWTLSLYHLHQGDARRVRMLADTALGRLGSPVPSLDSLVAEAIAAHAALAAGDSVTARRRFAGLQSRGSRLAVAYSAPVVLAPERLLLARLNLAAGQPRAAAAAASVLDHPQPASFPAFVAASLQLRADAARLLGHSALERTLRARLDRLRPPPPGDR